MHIPELHKRPSDIMPLLYYFLEECSKSTGLPNKEFTPEAQSLILAYSWPGNIRELRNFAEKLIVLVDAQTIKEDDISGMLSRKDKVETSRLLPIRKAKENFERSYIIKALELYENNVSKTALALAMPRSLLYKKIDKLKIKQIIKSR